MTTLPGVRESRSLVVSWPSPRSSPSKLADRLRRDQEATYAESTSSTRSSNLTLPVRLKGRGSGVGTALAGSSRARWRLQGRH